MWQNYAAGVMWLSNLEVIPFCVVMKMNLHNSGISQPISIKQLTILLDLSNFDYDGVQLWVRGVITE